MHGEQQDVFVLGHAQQARPHEWPGSQIEWDPCLLPGQFISPQRPLRLRQGRQVGLRQLQCERGGNDLDWRVVDHGERGAQHVMAAHDFVQCARQRLDVESSSQAHSRRNVVCGVAGIELVQEPDPLLCERGRNDRKISRPSEHRQRQQVHAPGAQQLAQLLPFFRRETLDRLDEVRVHACIHCWLIVPTPRRMRPNSSGCLKKPEVRAPS